jgi:hypothetical protein
MLSLIFMVFCFLMAGILPGHLPPRVPAIVRWAARGAFVVFGVFALASTSFYSVPADGVGLIQKKYVGGSLGGGHVVAAAGETGYQARILAPGSFNVSPGLTVVNSIETAPLVTIPAGFYGRIITLDGEELQAGQIMADAWGDSEFQDMLDAQYFMTHHGKKGLQASILKPGRYPLNLHLYNVKVGLAVNGADQTSSNDIEYTSAGRTETKSPLDTSITNIQAGFVGVVRSTISVPGIDCAPKTAATEGGGISAVVVPVGCKGVWDTPLEPGAYYLNRDAVAIIPVDTRVQVLTWAGGFTRRYIDLKVDSKGEITQSERRIDVPDRDDASDEAVFTKVEGWEVPQELRVQIQVRAKSAPVVVAAVGNLAEVERRVLIPGIRSIVRNVAGGMIRAPKDNVDGVPSGETVERQVRVMDLVNQRPLIEGEVLRLVELDAVRAGVDVREVRYGEAAIPPELLVARQREQLAGQLKLAYAQEQIAQVQRQQTEQARSTADQQGDLVKAQIAVQTAELRQRQRQAEGVAEQKFLEAVAAGQAAQTAVLGKDSVLQLNMLDKALALLASHPDILKGISVPGTVVIGGGASLEGPMAILGQALNGKMMPPAAGAKP